MANGCNLWVWLVSVVVRRYIYIIDILIIIITFPYSTCINSLHAGSLKLGFYIILQQRGSLKLGYADFQNINN